MRQNTGHVSHLHRNRHGQVFRTLLAAAEVAKTTTDFFVVLQNDLTDSLRLCFRISEVSSPASIATSFSIALDKSIKLRLVFDNVLDGGVSSDTEKDILNALALNTPIPLHNTKESYRVHRRTQWPHDLLIRTTRHTIRSLQMEQH